MDSNARMQRRTSATSSKRFENASLADTGVGFSSRSIRACFKAACASSVLSSASCSKKGSSAERAIDYMKFISFCAHLKYLPVF